ncbi:sister chromatid cohesion protein 1 [Steccherinum ochraceum]|uniref:Sister chromatid cohesion protein 1 n=1 Tax=Steccherinum ochraceum TaxID=92696 RepID=A0A4R0S051_9APHY|nr:sister chromatid cohesion protein 1 [Steccherinum ochraceum]
MFYSEAILSRRGPLAKVWLAAHMERKLSKTQTLQTDIEQSVDAIMGQEVEVMALRLSGQLLLGVVRIYSRKAKYLLDDCNEALLKIKMAFKPGVVDMTEDQLAVNQNAITLQVSNLDLDALLPDINWDMDFEPRVAASSGQHIARSADITLANAGDFAFDFDAPDYGFDLGPSDGIGSQDFEELDLGLDFGDGPVAPAAAQGRDASEEADDTMEVEVGRDAGFSRGIRESLGSHLLGDRRDDLDLLSHRSREASQLGDMNDFGPDIGDMEIDLGLDFGDQPMELIEGPVVEPAEPLGENPFDREATPQLTPSRASSPLTPPPQTPPPDVELTPHIDAAKGKRKPREQKQIIDAVTELADGPGARGGRGRNALGAAPNVDTSGILTEHAFLPRSTLVMRLLEIRDDPLAHFMPTRTTANGTFLCAAPPGLAPELQELFMRPVQTLTGPKRRSSQEPPESPIKKRRTEGSVAPEGDDVDVDDLEQGRRESRAPSVAVGSEAFGGRASVGPGFDFGDQSGPVDDFQMDVPEFEMDAGIGMEPEHRARSKSVLSELSRLSTPAPENAPLEEGEETYADAKCPIAIFDDRGSSQSQDTVTQASSDDGKGYSKHTVQALGIIRRELQPAPDSDEPKVMSFKKMSDKASRRAASAFFFELLVLGTRDCVKLTQSGPFENIEVTAKDRLWERQRHGSAAPSSSQVPSGFRHSSAVPSMRQSSVAPSLASQFGL